MSRSCTVCGNRDRDQIDQAIVSGLANRAIAARYGVSEQAIRRHATDHVPVRLRLAAAAQEATEADRLLAELVNLKNRAISLLLEAERSGDLAASARLIREARATIEVLLEVRGELDRRPTITVSVVQTPDWAALRTVIVAALDHHPEARLALQEAVDRYEMNGTS